MLSPESTVSHTTNKTHTVAQLMRISRGAKKTGDQDDVRLNLALALTKAMDISRSVLVAALSENPTAFKTEYVTLGMGPTEGTMIVPRKQLPCLVLYPFARLAYTF